MMIRYVVDEVLIKITDYFKFNDNTINTNSNATTIVDANNNNIIAKSNYNSSYSHTTNNFKRTRDKIVQNKKNHSEESLYDQLDWFKPFIKNQNQTKIIEKSTKRNYFCKQENVFDNYLKFYKLKFGEEPEEEEFDKTILFDSFKSSIDQELDSFFTLNNIPKIENKIKKSNLFKMSLINKKNVDDQNGTNDLLYSYFENETDTELVDLLKNNLSKIVEAFQKSYYQEPIKGEVIHVTPWRMKEKMKTVSAALVMCLNIGVDPPDVVKTSQSSKLECWINQTLTTPQKVLEMIGIELQKQYERWQPRARYKHCLDPTAEDVRKLCISLRKNAKDERVLFHYNGHGVPRPTPNGEIWVFNKEFTQYIPLSLYEVQTWMGTPSIYVWDCSNAGLVVQSFLQFEEDRENEYIQRTNESVSATASNQSHQQSQAIPTPIIHRIRDSIHLAACGRNELLPSHPDLPLDLFTACLTTPIKAAVHWYVSQKNSCQLVPGLTLDLLEKIPGAINDRKSMMGELNWIFTAITDTIAWNVLDSDLFQKLFRQDLLVASLFRNFLLAERIMKSLDCTPVSHPQLPSTNEHPLWQSWDLALDMCISQLPHIVNNNNVSFLNNFKQKEFSSCGFFAEQIEIFDVWLRYNVNSHSPPEQLPIVLQVLLSQQHRLKALELLGKFLDFGPWAVSAALSVGIFPYVLKLLSTQPRELRPLLTFVWAKILAVDKSCQAELVKDKEGLVYFIQALHDPDVESTHKVYSAFVLSCLVNNYPLGQENAKQNHLIATCSYLFTLKQSKDYKNPMLRQWCCICLGLCWQNYPEARWEGVRNNVHASLIELLTDSVPEVRSAAIFALGTYIGCGQGNEATIEQTNKLDAEIVSALIKDYDMCYMVRKELISALFNYINQFLTQSNNNTNNKNNNNQHNGQFLGILANINKLVNNLFIKVWALIVDMQNDPYPEVAEYAQRVISYFMSQINNFDLIKKTKILDYMQDQPKPLQIPLDDMKSINEQFQTEFVPWCCKYFLKPLLSTQPQQLQSIIQSSFKLSNEDSLNDPYSKHVDIYATDFLDQHCKLLYNHKVKRKIPPQWIESQNMDEILLIKHKSIPIHLKFNPFDDQLFVVDQDCFINVYDTHYKLLNDNRLKLNFSIFQNSNSLSNIVNNAYNSKRSNVITSFKLINPQHELMFLTGTNDRVVRLFKPDLTQYTKSSLITAFKAFEDNQKRESTGGKEVGLIVEWNETNEQLLCAGDTDYIRVWDMNKELYKDYATRCMPPSCVSSLTSQDNYTVAGFGEGSIKLFDFRQPVSAISKQIYQHDAFVLKVKLHRPTNKLITSSSLGDINIFDIRSLQQSIKSSNSETATAVEVHSINQLIAVGNSSQTVKIFNFNDKQLACIKHHEGFLGKRIATPTCLDWNQYKNEIAFGSEDNFVTVFSCKDNQ